MRLVVQRVLEAGVRVDDTPVATIGTGLLVLAGFGKDDDETLPDSRRWNAMCDKLIDLRIFPDAEGRMNRSLREHGGEVLLVSQFTLYADLCRGRRPSFQTAAPPDTARNLYERLVHDIDARLPGRVSSGIFGALMHVSLINWGPVTLCLDDAELFPEASVAG